jgi:chromosomal replication initiator protein
MTLLISKPNFYVRVHGVNKHKITLDGIIWAVTKVSGYSEKELTSNNRKREIMWWRHCIAYLACKHTYNSLQSIGLRLGGRDHTTIMNARTKIQNYLDYKDMLFVDRIKQIETLL